MLVGIQQTFLEISEFRRILKCLQDSVVQIETGVFRHFRAENLYFRDERLVSNFSPNNCIAESGKTFVKSREKLKRFSKQTVHYSKRYQIQANREKTFAGESKMKNGLCTR